MLFNSTAYLIFLPIVFLLYWSAPHKWRNALLVIASFVFYGWWDVRFLGLMVATCLANYLLALGMGEKDVHRPRNRRRKLLCTLAILINFAILSAFKYFNFFAASLSEACATFGWQLHFPVLHILLPVGISFYTFQVTGYIIDVYRGSLPPERSATRFFAFISFFPQLVAGPIERATQLLPQFAVEQKFSRPMAVDGMRQILWGLLKKMLIADNCAAVANYIFAHSDTVSSTDLWIGTFCFAFQIYGDFSGYSDMAVGSAKLFGIRLMRNFDRPYFSQSIPEFWRRWHISLMTWFRDYLYIPLGGNRRGTFRKYLNTVIVFLVSGLWHGANWTFIAWGAYHALLFLPYSLLTKARTSGGRLGLLSRTLTTFLLVLLGWVFFRAESLSQAFDYLSGMFSPERFGPTTCSRLPLLYVALMLAAEGFSRGEHPLALRGTGLMRHRTARLGLYYLLFLTALFAGGKPESFIYFQF